MTTLFNLFCPYANWLSIFSSVWALVMITLLCTIVSSNFFLPMKGKKALSISLFPDVEVKSSWFFSGFIIVGFLNLISLVGYGYPVTATLSFNLSMALILWGISVVLMMLKPKIMSSLLPMDSPWYLVPFLSLVELVSVMVRPITLCFRLLANMSAGHILLALICKLQGGVWLLGVLFGLLELMVAIVQSFVFLMLVKVYLEESLNHYSNSSFST